jgi:ubiquitin conjugation factor E4 B
MLPEYFIEDMAEFLLIITQLQPQLLQANAAGLDGLMLFMVVFIGSPGYLRSPWLRSKLTEILHAWLPRDGNSNSFRRT